MKDVESFVLDNDENSYDDLDVIADEISDCIEIDELNEDEYSTLTYVCGAVIKSVCNTTKCLSCRRYLISEDQTNNEPNFSTKYLEQVNRDGLLIPTEYAWKTCVRMFSVFKKIKESNDLLDKFMKAKNQSVLFHKITERTYIENKLDSLICFSIFCDNNHDMQLYICKSLFNCFSKNFVRYFSDDNNMKNVNSKIKKLRN